MITSKDKILIISPHLDDEILGAGMMMRHAYKVGASVHIIFMTVGDAFSWSLNKRVSKDVRIEEMKNACSSLHPDFTYEILYYDKDAELETIPKREVITKIDQRIHDDKYSIVLYPYPSHHQDHVYTYDVTCSALRTVPDFNPRLKLIYEYTYIDSFSPHYHPKGGKVYLVGDESDIEAKINAFKLYKSQVQRAPNDLLHPSSVKSLANVRGLECGNVYAESYYVHSLIIKD